MQKGSVGGAFRTVPFQGFQELGLLPHTEIVYMARNPKSAIFTIRIDADLLENLRQRSKEERVTLSEIVRTAIEYHVHHDEGTQIIDELNRLRRRIDDLEKRVMSRSPRDLAVAEWP